MRSVFPLHVAIWVGIVLFPSLKAITGDVAVSQKFLHLIYGATVGPLAIGLALDRSVETKTIRGALILVFVAITYFGFSTLLGTKELNWRDLADIVRPFVYFIYFLFPLLFPLRQDEFKYLIRLLVTIAIFQLLFSSLVYVPESWPIVDLYKGRLSSDAVHFHFLRWSGTVGYPSDFSFFLSFFVYYSLYKLHIDFRMSGRRRSATWLLFLLCGGGILMTASRGGIGTVGVMLCIILLFTGVGRDWRLGLALLALLALGLWVVFGLGFLTVELIAYVLSVLSISSELDASAVHRVKELELAASYFLDYFPVGPGANRSELSDQINVIESTYGYYMSKWGLTGILLYFCGVVFIAMRGISVYKHATDAATKAFAAAVVILNLSVPLVFGFSSAITDRYKGLPFFYLLVGYLFSLGYSRGRGERREREMSKQRTSFIPSQPTTTAVGGRGTSIQNVSSTT